MFIENKKTAQGSSAAALVKQFKNMPAEAAPLVAKFSNGVSMKDRIAAAKNHTAQKIRKTDGTTPAGKRAAGVIKTSATNDSKGPQSMPPTATTIAPPAQSGREIPRSTSDYSRYRHLAPRLKAFRSGNPRADIEQAKLCGWELQARIAIHYWKKRAGERNALAERRLRDRGIDIFNIATATSPTGGGYTVPTPLASKAIELRDVYGVSRQLASVVPMEAGSESVPKVNSGYTVYSPTETFAATPSDLVLGSAQINARTRFTLSYASRELCDDGLISWVDLAVRHMALAHAAHEDNCFCNGDGSSTYDNEVGVIPAVGAAGIAQAATGHDTLPELVVSDWTSCMAKQPATFQTAANCWLMSPQVYALGALGAVGGNAQGFDPITGRPMHLGSPVFLSAKMPAAPTAGQICALFGNFEMGVSIGDRTPFELAISEHFEFDNDLLTLLGRTRFGISAHGLGDGSTAGAVVALKLAA